MNHTRLIIAAIVNRGALSDAQRRAIFAKRRTAQATGGSPTGAPPPRFTAPGQIAQPATPPASPGGTQYAGGSPNFDERTGQPRPPQSSAQAGSVTAPPPNLAPRPPAGFNYPANMPPAGMKWAYTAEGARVAVPQDYVYGDPKRVAPAIPKNLPPAKLQAYLAEFARARRP